MSRIILAFSAFFSILFNRAFAEGVLAVREGRALPSDAASTKAVPVKVVPPAPVMREASTDAALQLLALLQREGRFVDFIEEDLSGASDADIGAAARVVHTGCRKALAEHVKLEPVRSENEEARVTLPPGFNASEVRITGNVVGQPPFTGTLRHRGWRAASITLPQMAVGHDAKVVCPAEVEL